MYASVDHRGSSCLALLRSDRLKFRDRIRYDREIENDVHDVINRHPNSFFKWLFSQLSQG
jgi:hypothetical protein